MNTFRVLVLLFCIPLVTSSCVSENPVSVNEETLTFDAVVDASATTAKAGLMVTRPFIGEVNAETIFSVGPQPCFLAPEVCAQRCPNAVMPTWVIAFSGRGHATHVGQFDLTAEHCSVVEFDPDTMMPIGAVYGDGTFELVAANGDRISGTYGNYGEEDDGVSATVAPGVGDFHDRVDMKTGTGRFTRVSGVVQEDGLFSVSTGAITHWTMHGEISYDASDRRNH